MANFKLWACATFGMALLVGSAIGAGPAAAPEQKSVAAQPAPISGAGLRNMDAWCEFMPRIAPTAKDAVSLEFLLDAPAGKHGPLKVTDAGHFQFEDGTPARFWATNFALLAVLPTHEESEALAQTLARYGCNLVRLHLIESALIDRTAANRQTFVGENEWDHFDYLIKCLKDKGIYVLIGSLSGLSNHPPYDPFVAADGVVGAEHYSESWAYYDPHLREIGRHFLTGVLTHVNRYTGKSLAEEPAVALAGLLNEQTPLRWDLAKQPEYYRDELRKRFNDWLLKQYSTREALAEAWRLPDGGTALGEKEDPAQGTVLPITETAPLKDSSFTRLRLAVDTKASPQDRLRAQTTVRFLQYLQADFDTDMIGVARKLGAKFPIVGTNWSFDLAELDCQILPDHLIDDHAYYDYPNDKTAGIVIMHNLPEVSVNILRPENSHKTLCEAILGSHRVAGCALISTENNTTWPQEWRSSHMMLTGANAAHQQIDAIFEYAFGGGWGLTWSRMMNATRILHETAQFNDPAMVSSFMAGAFLYLRGDVSPARSLVRYEVEPPQNLATGVWWWLANANFPANYVPFVSRFEILFKDNPTPAVATPDVVIRDRGTGAADDSEKRARELDAQLKAQSAIPKDTGLGDGCLTSDTGEIVRDWKNQISTVNTPRSQGFSGFPTSKPIELKDVSIVCSTMFATMQLSSLDNQPLASSGRMLLIAVGRADNKDAKVTYAATKPTPSGALRGEQLTDDTNAAKGPVVIEPIVADIALKAAGLRVTPLRGDMTPDAASAWEVKGGKGYSVISIGKTAVSAWYLVERLP